LVAFLFSEGSRGNKREDYLGGLMNTLEWRRKHSLIEATLFAAMYELVTVYTKWILWDATTYTDPKLVWEKINQFGNTHILKTNALGSGKIPKHFVLSIGATYAERGIDEALVIF
jgi:hypothetical protein